MEWYDTLYWICLALVIIGGLNWLIIGLFNYNVIAAIFGTATLASAVVYVIVGLAALYLIFAAAIRPRPAAPVIPRVP